MGCDGGTIPRRDELVRVKKKPEQKDKDAEREFRWLHCALTQQRLQQPIVMCGLGRLYTKQSVIEQLLDKSKMPEAVQHIRNMRDIKTLNLTPNPAYTEEDKNEGLLDARHAPYICKLSGLEMLGKFRFVALWSCGCVMSERALKQIKGNSSNCPLCQKLYHISDIIVLNGNEEDVELLKAKMEMRTQRRKFPKKEKKEKNKIGGNCADSAQIQEGQACTSKATTTEKKEERSNIHKNKLHAAPPKRFAAGPGTMQDPEIKRLKTEYSVAKDPKATDVYKSLFTTHKTEKEQNRAHWITYNPFYN